MPIYGIEMQSYVYDDLVTLNENLTLCKVIFYFQISKNPYACVCGHALCENCLHSEKRILHDSKECDLLKALVDQENNHITTDFDRTQQMPNYVYEPIASLRLLMTKW